MRKFLSSLVLITLSACGGGAPSAESPEGEGSDDTSSSDESKPDEGDTSDGDETSDADESGGDDESSSDSGGSAKTLLTQEGTVFLYDFTKSEAGERVQERCEESSGGDAEKKANCLSKATPKRSEGIRFHKEPDGTWFFVRFEVKNKQPIEHNRVACEFGDDSGKKITIKTMGPDKARARKGKVPAEFEIEVPDEYTLVIQEPGKGKVVYEAKLGLFDAE